jgi:uncharacterized protein YidB (DUF937 family)
VSGPKVVRIVTVEEVRQTCHAHLSRLEAAVARWEKVCRRNDAATDAEVKSVRERSAEIASLMHQERYVDLQKRVPEEIQWLEADLERRVGEAQRRIAVAQMRVRRRATIAAQLLQRASLSETVRQTLKAIVRGDDSDAAHAEAVISEVMRTSSPATNNEQHNSALQALAQRLATGLKGATLDEWLNAQGSSGESEHDAVADKIDAAIAGLAVAGAAEEAAALSARHRALLGEPESAARKMRGDTLLLEAARALERRRERDRRLAELEQTLSEARSLLGPAHAGVIAEAEGALVRADVPAVMAAKAALSSALDDQRKSDAAAARRRTLLSALADTGYEVREGMETETPAAGNVVLRRAANPEMGIEIIGGVTGSRLQLRPVRFAPAGASGDTSKDRDVETIWCSDFAIMNDRLRALDAEMVIERATPVGAAPVTVVQEEPDRDTRLIDATRKGQQQRS